MKSWQFAASALMALSLAACGGDDDDTPVNETPTPETPAPETPKPSEPRQISALELLGRHESGVYFESAAEIPVYDRGTKRAFVVNAKAGVLDVLDLSNPAAPSKVGVIDASTIAPGATVNSVGVHHGVLALAIEPAVKTDPGFVALYRADSFARLGVIGVGSLPDMLVFTPDGRHVLVANEGEPSDDYSVDPVGSISIIDVTNPAAMTVRTAGFEAWNGRAAELRAKGVILAGPKGTTVAQDLEPEYVAISADGLTAWAALQENNALARIDVAAARVIDILPLGAKDHGLERNALDVSDSDGEIRIQAWPGVRGLYMPDAIAAYAAAGQTYIVTANEGDARAWGEESDAYWGWGRDADGKWLGLDGNAPGFVDEFRVKHLVHDNGFERRALDDLPPQLRQLADGARLNPTVFAYCGATVGAAGDCREDELLGRLKVNWTLGYQTQADGSPRLAADGRLVYDALYAYGARSFSIWSADGELVWDSGDEFERHLASVLPDYFNSGHDETVFDGRSASKGPEPEGVVLGTIDDRTYAFVGLERIGGVMVYDITDPRSPSFITYINSRDFSVDSEANPEKAGDLGPEGLFFVPAEDSPNGEPLLIVGNEVSGTTSVYRIVLDTVAAAR